MAAANQIRSLMEEATCAICLDYFTDPVSVECGHTFCLSCITQYWEGLETDFPGCPECRKTSQSKRLRPNKRVANMVEISKQLHVPSATSQEVNLCRKHEEKLKVFCEDDQEPICVVCSMSLDHKQHTMLPILEAAQEYKEKFQSYLDRLKNKLEDVLELHRKEETKVTELEAEFRSERERITKEFEKLIKVWEKKKSCHLRSLEEEEKQSLQIVKETVTQLEEQQSVLRSMITEIEWKCQQQDVEIFKDLKRTLRRYEHVKVQLMGGETLKEKEDEEDQANLQKKIIESLANVTLDPDTAHRRLVMSKDRRSVRRGDRALDLPDTPQRFHPALIILGRERLSSRRHYWAVEVGDKTSWILGVCDESVRRKGNITASPENGYWTVCLKDGNYDAGTSPPTLLAPRVPPRAVGLFLDYEAGRLSVYNVDDRSLLFTFSGASFPPTLRPLFNPGLNEGGRNAGALRILPVTGRE